MKMHKILAFPAAVVLATLALSACGDGDDTSADRETTQEGDSIPGAPSGTGGSETDGTEAPGGSGVDAASVTSALTAIAAAEGEVQGTAYEISAEDGGWEIDVAVGDRSHEVRVGPDGNVLEARDDDDLDDDDRAGLAAAELTIIEAIEAAEEAAPEGILDEVNLDQHQGTHVWEVVFEAGGVDHEVHVDVATGDVLHTSVDD